MPPLVWFFDLDDTLHDASHRVFGTIDRSMNAWLVANLAVDEAEANRLRTDYWHRYGATLLGLVKHHTIDVHAFLRETHSFAETPDLATLVRAERGLTDLFRRLPGRKVLLTNAPTLYAHGVLKQIGLAPHIRRRYAIEQMRIRGSYRPKPSRAMLTALLAREKVRGSRAVLIEDSLPNLKSARAIGMRTVLVSGFASRAARLPATQALAMRRFRSAYVDLRVESVTQLIRRRRFLR